MTLKQFEKQKYLNIETFRKTDKASKLPFGLFRMGKRFMFGPMPGPAKPSGFAGTAQCASFHARQVGSHAESGSARWQWWTMPPTPFNMLKA
jgi:hypothetical protein